MNPIQAIHQRSIQQKDAFWREEAAGIHWETPFTEVLNYSIMGLMHCNVYIKFQLWFFLHVITNHI
jgi:hypothetical protein